MVQVSRVRELHAKVVSRAPWRLVTCVTLAKASPPTGARPVATVQHGLANARIEQVNIKIAKPKQGVSSGRGRLFRPVHQRDMSTHSKNSRRPPQSA